MQKNYVLDTNVLIQAPYALESFEDNHIVLPVTVLEELDSLKTQDGECGANARQVIRYLEKLRLTGNLMEGVQLETGGMLRLEINHVDISLPEGFSDKLNDNRILRISKGIKEKEKQVVLVTKDIVLRMKAQMLGIDAEDFITDQVTQPEEQYTGRIDLFMEDQYFSTFKRKGVSMENVYTCDAHGDRQPVELVVNQFCILRSDVKAKKTMLGIFDGEKIVALSHGNKSPYGVKPKNVGQQFMQEALMTPHKKAPLVIVKGPAGTAKTFYSLAVGLEKTLNKREPDYRKILVCRSNVQFDKEIGFLPGDEQEKIAPLLRPVMDNLEILVDSDDKERYKNESELKSKVDFLFDNGIITAEAINFIRGRSISNIYLIIDEAQNLTPRQVKGIITRVGKGTKVVLLGDPAQIDHPLLDERTNGLSYACERMKGSELCYQLTMNAEECERSELALDAAQRM